MTVGANCGDSGRCRPVGEGGWPPGQLADVPSFERFTGDASQFGHEVGVLPLCYALFGNLKVSLDGTEKRG